MRDSFWLAGMIAGFPACYDCIKAFSETDFTPDLKKMSDLGVPTLVVCGDDDQIVPYKDASVMSAKLVKGSILKVYEGAPHGLPSTMKDRLNTDLLEFITTSVKAPVHAN